MKTKWFTLSAALVLWGGVLPEKIAAHPHRGESIQFRGVCQTCGHDLLAVYRPVRCLDGGCQWQWVRVPHDHCRPAYLGRRKPDFFRSHWMNPANPKGKSLRARRTYPSPWDDCRR